MLIKNVKVFVFTSYYVSLIEIINADLISKGVEKNMEIVDIIPKYTGYMRFYGELSTYILPGICFFFLFFDIVVVLIERIRLKKIRKNTEEVRIYSRSPEEIASVLYTMNYPKRKNSGVNSEGKAFLKGKYGTYIFDNVGSNISISCENTRSFSKIGKWFLKHKQYRRELEMNAILNWMNKYLEPTSIVDSQKIYKSFRVAAFLDKMPITIAFLALAGCLVSAFYFQLLHEEARSMRNLEPELWKGITYDQALDSYADDLLWDYYTAEDDTKVLNAYGKFKYAYEKASFMLQFSTDAKGEWVSPYAMEVNGKPISSDAMNYIVVEMFENFENKTQDSDFSSVDELEEALQSEDIDEERSDDEYEDVSENEEQENDEQENDYENITTTTAPQEEESTKTTQPEIIKETNPEPEGFSKDYYTHEVSIEQMMRELYNDSNDFLAKYVGSGVKTKARIQKDPGILHDPKDDNSYMFISSYDGVSLDNYSDGDVVTVYGYVNNADAGGARGEIDFVVQYIEEAPEGSETATYDVTVDDYYQYLLGEWYCAELGEVYDFYDIENAMLYYASGDELYYDKDFTYNLNGEDLYMNINVGTTTCYQITFDGTDTIYATEMSQGVSGWTYMWERVS